MRPCVSVSPHICAHGMQVCGYLFEFKNLYRADAPAILPCWELAWGLLQKSAKSLRIVARVSTWAHQGQSHGLKAFTWCL